jgi:allantoin racemase
MCTIPVTATLESAALVAHMMGRRFSLITVDDQNGQIQQMLLGQYQLDRGLVSVRSFGIDANDLVAQAHDEDFIRDRCVAAGIQAIEQDGSEVLIAGCTLAGSVLSRCVKHNPDLLPAPIIDGMLTGFKMAEMMVSLRRAGMPPVSRIGFYEHPPVAEIIKLRKAQQQPIPTWADLGDPA